MTTFPAVTRRVPVHVAAGLLAALCGGCLLPPATHKLALPDVIARVTVERSAGGDLLVVGPVEHEAFGLPAGHAESSQLRSGRHDGSWRHAWRLSLQDTADTPRLGVSASIHGTSVAVATVSASSDCAPGRCTQRVVFDVSLTEAQLRQGGRHGLGLTLTGAGRYSNHFLSPAIAGGHLTVLERLRAEGSPAEPRPRTP